MFFTKIKVEARITADSIGSVCDGKCSIMNPPTMGVMIWAMLVRELFTPSIVAVSFWETLFVMVLVRIGLVTPVP